MVNLVKKEFKVSKSWIFLLIISIIFSFVIFVATASAETTGIRFIQNIAYSYAVFMVVYVSIIDSNYQDTKNKSEVILNSLPINKGDIVKAKYLILILNIIIYSLVMGITIKIFMPLIYSGGDQLQILWSLVIVTAISLVFYSLYYPLYFKSEDGLMVFNQVFRIAIVILPSILQKFSKKLPMNKLLDIMVKLGDKKIGIFLLALTFVIYCISFQISKKIYLGKEF